MAGKIISITNGKGGTGKTTTAYPMACGLTSMGYNVLLVDLDQQRSSEKWAAAAQEAGIINVPKVVSIQKKSFKDDVLALKGAFDYIILDSPGSLDDDKMPAQLMKISDFIFIPIQPSPMDVEDSRSIIELAETTLTIRDNLQVFILITRDKEQTILSKTIGNALDDFEIPMFPVRILDGELHKQVRGSGNTLFDDLKGLSKAENKLVDNMKAFLNAFIEVMK